MKLFVGCLLLFTILGHAQQFTKVMTGSVVTDGGDSRSANWIDVDSDGDLDLYVTNGNVGGSFNFLYKNNGNGTFTKITDGTLVSLAGSYDGSTWGDYNNDGEIDLFSVTWYGQLNTLFRQVNGTFEYTSSGSVAREHSYSETASWADYDNDGYLDLYVANSAVDKKNMLFKNNRDGSFTKITTGALVEDAYTSRSVDWGDVDGDGFLDLFVANEKNEPNSLYRNNGDGTFTRISDGSVLSEGGDSYGSSLGDIDNDGDLDIFVANFGNQNNFLYKNDGKGNFTKVTNDIVVQDGGYSIGSSFGDIDNDGDLDLFVTNAFGPNNLLLHNFLYLNNGDGSFVKVTEGSIVTDVGWSYGTAMGDFDRDGDLDIFTANCFNSNQNNALHQNIGNGNSWLTVHVSGSVSNRSGIGTKIRVKSTINGSPVWQTRTVSGQSGYCGQNLEAHFGMGNSTMIDSLIAEFPSGLKVVKDHITPNSVMLVQEPIPSNFLRSAFIVDSVQGRIPFTVRFSDISIADPYHPITSWAWDFNDDGIIDATTQHPTWMYSVPDSYSVSLTVSNGVTSTTLRANKMVSVLRPASPPSILSAVPQKPDTVIAKNGKVFFSVSVIDTSDSPVRFEWRRNGQVQSTASTYTYISQIFVAAPRVDTVRLTVSNDFYSIERTWLITVQNTVSSVNESTLMPGNYLLQNYPNPFNPTTTIQFHLDREDFVTLKLYDSLGKEVQTLIQGYLGQGSHMIPVNAESLSSGTYLYSLHSSVFTSTRKFTVIK